MYYDRYGSTNAFHYSFSLFFSLGLKTKRKEMNLNTVPTVEKLLHWNCKVLRTRTCISIVQWVNTRVWMARYCFEQNENRRNHNVLANFWPRKYYIQQQKNESYKNRALDHFKNQYNCCSIFSFMINIFYFFALVGVEILMFLFVNFMAHIWGSIIQSQS